MTESFGDAQVVQGLVGVREVVDGFVDCGFEQLGDGYLFGAS